MLFIELLTTLNKINTSDEIEKPDFNFSGFHFCTKEGPITLNNFISKGNLDFSHCDFSCGFELSDSKLSSIDVRQTNFKEIVKIVNVQLVNNLTATLSSYHNGLKISNCELNGYTFLDSCNFKNDANNFNCTLRLEDCKSVNQVDLSKSQIAANVVFIRSTFNQQVTFDHCQIYNEFYFRYNIESTPKTLVEIFG